jgi:tetratricopeptide (TPR) repeat protein
MKRTLVNGTLALLLIGAATLSGFAQNVNWTGNQYPEYMAVFNEKDEAKKAALAEKYLADHKTADPVILTQIYQFMLLGYAKSGNWPKTLESVERMDAATKLTDAEKKQYVQIGLLAASNSKNNAKTIEYAEKVLKDDPKNFNALITLSGVLSATVPASGPPKDAHIERTLKVTKDALALPKPAEVPDAQWNPIQSQLRQTSCLMLLNQQKYTDSMAECQAALKINPKDAFAWYWIGLSHRAELIPLAKKYNDAVDAYNQGRDKGQLVVDELRAAMQGADTVATNKRDETVDALARAAAIGGEAGKQAMAELQKIFTGTPDELNRLIQEKK